MYLIFRISSKFCRRYFNILFYFYTNIASGHLDMLNEYVQALFKQNIDANERKCFLCYMRKPKARITCAVCSSFLLRLQNRFISEVTVCEGLFNKMWCSEHLHFQKLFEPGYSIFYKTTYASSEDSNQLFPL